MNREQQLRQQIQALNDELWAIAEAREREKNEALVGKCFVYMNSYGSGESWPLYLKVVALGDGSVVKCVSFQRCVDGRYEVDSDARFVGTENCSEIPEEMLVTAWLQVQQELAKIGKQFG